MTSVLSPAEKAQRGVGDCRVSVSYCDKLREWVVMDGSVMGLQLIRPPDSIGRLCVTRPQATEDVRSRMLQSNARAQSAKPCQRTSEKSLRNAAISAS